MSVAYDVAKCIEAGNVTARSIANELAWEIVRVQSALRYLVKAKFASCRMDGNRGYYTLLRDPEEMMQDGKYSTALFDAWPIRILLPAGKVTEHKIGQ